MYNTNATIIAFTKSVLVVSVFFFIYANLKRVTTRDMTASRIIMIAW